MEEGEGMGDREASEERRSVYHCEKEKESWQNNFSMRRGKNLAKKKKKLLLLAALFVKRGCQALYNTWD